MDDTITARRGGRRLCVGVVTCNMFLKRNIYDIVNQLFNCLKKDYVKKHL